MQCSGSYCSNIKNIVQINHLSSIKFLKDFFVILGSANFSMEDFGADNPGLGAYGASNINTPGCDIELVCAPNDIRKRFIKNCKTMKFKNLNLKMNFKHYYECTITLLQFFNLKATIFCFYTSEDKLKYNQSKKSL